MDKDRTYQLGHTYELDGDPDERWTVIARGVDPSYVMLQRDGGFTTLDNAIYPLAVDGSEESLLLPCPMNDENDFDDDGTPLPYWLPIGDCPDVTGQRE